MDRYNFVFRDISVCRTDAFTEARTDEFKLLIALYELGGKATDEELSDLSGISKSRCAAALDFWCGAGIIAPVELGEYGNSIGEEFSEREDDVLLEQTSLQVASQIRDKKLADLMVTLAELLEKPALSPSEVKKITTLTGVYGLSDDYIAELASYMKEHAGDKGAFSVFKLYSRAVRLCDEGIDTTEALEIHIKNEKTYMEIRMIVGIYNRQLTKYEKESFNKWCYEFGYSPAIIKLAFDESVEYGKGYNRAYMDKVLSGWHAAGCKTVEDCLADKQRFKDGKNTADVQKPTAQKSERSSRKPKSNAPKFGDIDPEDALKKALARSFWDKKGN